MGKLTGRLGMAIGAAAGYVLGAKAGRERYEQLAGAAKKLTEQPPVKRVVEQAPGTVSATVDKVADRAADKVRQAGDRVASGGRDGGADPVVRVRDTAPSGGRLAEDPVPPPVPASPKVTNPASGQTTKP